MRLSVFRWFAAAVAVFATFAIAHADPVVTISSRNKTINAIWLTPDGTPLGAVILFAGGLGRLDIASDGTIRFLRQNFLVRARGLFAQAGYAVLVPDLAPDMKSGDTGVVDGYRASEDYATDIDHMVRSLRAQGIRRIYVIGTSRGTLSVANYVARLSRHHENLADGQIYTSGYWKVGADARGFTIWKFADGDARRLRLPTLLSVHNEDSCPDTNPADIDAFQSWLAAGGAAVDLQRFAGGAPPQSGPCDAQAPHGFYGLDAAVVGRMTAWLRQQN